MSGVLYIFNLLICFQKNHHSNEKGSSYKQNMGDKASSGLQLRQQKEIAEESGWRTKSFDLNPKLIE